MHTSTVPSDPLAETDLMRSLVEHAVLAPSSHNTQPWVFRIDGRRLELYADRTRALAVNDPHDRELTISCGAALHNVRVAAAHAGATLDVVTLPEGDASDLLATVTAGRGDTAARDDRLFGAIGDRRTYREQFAGRDVPSEVLEELSRAAATEGAQLQILGAEARTRLVSLVAEGDRRQFADPHWRRELAAWMHPRRDGEGLVVPALTAHATRFVVANFDVGRSTAGKDAKLAERSPVLAVLTTDADSPADWLLAGQALQRVLLTATTAGLQASYLNQPVQVEQLRPRVTDVVNGNGCPQVALRLGYPTHRLAPAPRRPIAAVVADSGTGSMRGVASRRNPRAPSGRIPMRANACLARLDVMHAPPPSSVDLYWIPLGAGGHSVRFNGRVFEAIEAARQHRPRCALYHAALIVTLDGDQHTIELAPAWDANAAGRGVVSSGAVGSRHLGRWRLFRYELRCWRGGSIPDLRHAVGGPRHLSSDASIARRVIDIATAVPTPVWGRDELDTGEMWNSNSVIAWLIATAGIPTDGVQPPAEGRAPGWNAGLVVAARKPSWAPRPGGRVRAARRGPGAGPGGAWAAVMTHQRRKSRCPSS